MLIAGCQTGGRGRLGRRFESPPEGLYLSMLLRPECTPERMASITAASAVAVRRAIECACSVSADIKWPNDLLLGGKKICGILTELNCCDGANALVIGVGINVNTRTEQFPPELRDTAGSILTVTGKTADRQKLAGQLIKQLDEMYKVWLDDRQAFLEEYRAACINCGRELLILQNGQTRTARALGINEDYSLAVVTEQGREDISFGEVSIRGL